MGNFIVPKKNLAKFLKTKNEKFSRKKLTKLGSGVASGVVIFNIMFSTSSFAHTSTPHSNTPAVDIVDEITKEAVPGYPKCWRLVPSHVDTVHTNVPAVDIY